MLQKMNVKPCDISCAIFTVGVQHTSPNGGTHVTWIDASSGHFYWHAREFEATKISISRHLTDQKCTPCLLTALISGEQDEKLNITANLDKPEASMLHIEGVSEYHHTIFEEK